MLKQVQPWSNQSKRSFSSPNAHRENLLLKHFVKAEYRAKKVAIYMPPFKIIIYKSLQLVIKYRLASHR
jgi:hypothetical protein